MGRSEILSAAAALREFTAAQVAAYCEEDETVVARALAAAGELITPIPSTRPPRWRVTDPSGLHAAIIALTRAAKAPTPPARRPKNGDAQLLLAEETLIHCADEPSAKHRRLMAATARNYLQRFIADALPEAHLLWWEVGPSVLDAEQAGVAATRPRLLTDLALAELTFCEAADEPVDIGCLYEMAVELKRLPASRDIDDERVRVLSQRFDELTRILIRPPEAEVPGPQAPAKLLCALAWGRAGPARHCDIDASAQARVNVLGELARITPWSTDGVPARLFRVMGSPGHGQRRVVVYRDLLDLVPEKVTPEKSILTGALVVAVTDVRTSAQLAGFASALEADLIGSPYPSESALIGQVAHRIEDFAAETVDDREVNAKVTQTRLELLALADVDGREDPDA